MVHAEAAFQQELTALTQPQARADGEHARRYPSQNLREQVLSEGEQAAVRDEAAAPATSSGGDERTARAYVAVSVHMLGGGKARIGSCILVRGAAELLPPAERVLACQQPAAGRSVGELSTGSNASTAVFRRSVAGHACVACVPGQSHSRADAGALVMAQPDAYNKAGQDVGGSDQTACSSRPDFCAADAADQQPAPTSICTGLAPGCLLGFVTCGWQPGVSGACPVQGAVAVQSFSGAEGASQADVWVWDYRSGLLHAAVAQTLFL